MNTKILSIGKALPPGSLTQEAAADAAIRLRQFGNEKPTEPSRSEGSRKTKSEKRASVLRALYKRAGVEKRHSVLLLPGDEDAIQRQTFYQLADSPEDRGPTTGERMLRYGVEAPRLATAACIAAMEKAQVIATDIKHLVTVSCSGFSAPGFDLKLFESIGLNPSTSRTHIGFMGCHAALNGLRVASSYAAATDSVVLVCATELCSLHHQYTDDPQQTVANSLFGDGAAAFLVAPATTNDSPTSPWELIDQMSFLMPDSSEMMTWNIGDHGFEMTLSAQVPTCIETQLKPVLTRWLTEFGLRLEEVENWAVHPGGPRILSATAEALDISRQRFRVSDEVLSRYGNMSSPTIMFILEELLQSGTPGHCVALAFGPGLVVEAALLRRN